VAAAVAGDEKAVAVVPADDAPTPLLLLLGAVVAARHGGRSEDGDRRRCRRCREVVAARPGRRSVANVGWDTACLLFISRSIPQTEGEPMMM